jgi:glycerophosphoryl diester phosphodiesterase
LFAHRGEKVLLPEHTVPGYETASILGADFVEPDLCLTKDDVFVCHHDLLLRDGTDVGSRPEFAHLKRQTPDGFNWYIRDFTLAELKTLRIVQQDTGIRPQDYNGLFSIPTFDEYLAVIHRMTFKLNRTIGIVPELKVPTFHNQNRSENFMEKLLLQTLSAHGYPVNLISDGYCEATVDGKKKPIPCPPVIVQCFETPALAYLKSQSDLELLQLIQDQADLLTYKGIEEVGKIAKYYSTWKEYLYVGVAADMKYNNKTWNQTLIDSLGGFVPPRKFAKEVHRHGMKIVLFTIHDSREPSTRGCAVVPGCEPENKTLELDYFFDLGVDGIFIENVAESRAILSGYEDRVEVEAIRSQVRKFMTSVVTFTCSVSGFLCGKAG